VRYGRVDLHEKCRHPPVQPYFSRISTFWVEWFGYLQSFLLLNSKI